MKSISFERAVEIALEQHRAGNFSRAEGLYLEILRQDPGNVDAMHLLGVLAHQGHQPESAVQLIQAAIRKKPDIAVFH
jgi:Tfp pilus assembly protein PilF